MARWSSAGADWGQTERSYATRSIVAAGVIVLIIGVMAGYLIRGTSSSNGTFKAAKTSDSSVIDPSIAGMLSQPETQDGATRAVTAFVTGYPMLSVKTPQEASTALDQALAVNADPNLKTSFNNLLNTARDRLIGNGATQKQLTAKLVSSPASFQTEMLAKDRARVRVWYVTVYVDSSSQQASSSWTTADVQVQFTDHWRLTAFSSTNGPSPQLQADGSKFSSYNQVAGVFNGFTSYWYATPTPTK